MKEPERMYVNIGTSKKTYNRRKALSWFSTGQIIMVYHLVNGKWQKSGILQSKKSQI